MTITRRLLAGTAIAGLGLSAFATTAHAAPTATATPSATATPTASPRPATPRETPSATPTSATPTSEGQHPIGDWWVSFGKGSIDPTRLYPTAGTKYVLTGSLDVLANHAVTGFDLSFNPAPGSGAIRCTGTGSDGALALPGKIVWAGLNVADRKSVTYRIECTYQRDHDGAVNEIVSLNALHRVLKQDVPLVDCDTFAYTVGGSLPSASGRPTAGAQPTAGGQPTTGKDARGGLAKTGR